MKRRKTKSKDAVLSVLRESGTALNHEMIQSGLPIKTDRATIYRILNQFSADGVVHQIIGDDGKQYFALCINCLDKSHNHNHLHFRCEKCGTVECLKNEIDFKLPKGYVSTNFNGIVSGFCLNCASDNDKNE